MEALRHPGGNRDISEPGEHETWQELADHSIGHDQLSTAVPHPDAYRRYAAQRLAALAAARREQP